MAASKFGDKIIATVAAGEQLGFVDDDEGGLQLFGPDGAYHVSGFPYRSKADGKKDGAGNTYRAFKDK